MAIEFVPASSQYIACGSGSSIDNIFAGGGSLSVWAFVDDNTIETRWFGKEAGWLFGMADVGGGDLEMFFQHNWSGNDGQWHTEVPAQSVWVHVVVTYNKDSDANNAAIYYDAVSQSITERTAPTTAADSDAAANLLIGDVAGGNRSYDGKFEDPRMFSTILTQEQISQLAAGYRGPIGNEVLWLDMMTGRNGITAWAGTTLSTSEILPDLSVNSNDGTPTNNPVARESEAPRYGVLA